MFANIFSVKLCEEWKSVLYPKLDLAKLRKLQNFLTQEYSTNTVYPAPNDVFNALNNLLPEQVKVVIIGQDPYHEPGQAHGYAFSVKHGTSLPPSLKNIFKEIKNELGCVADESGDLTCWAKQGVLLLNTVLTVRKGEANSHKNKGWEELTSCVVSTLSQRARPVVFLLWGANARAFLPMIDTKKHLVLCCAHPSPLSAHAGFFGCGHFLKTNSFLQKIGQKPIIW